MATASSTNEDTLYRMPKPQPPSNVLHDVVLSFDTTGSMSVWIQELRSSLQTYVTNIFDRYEDVQIAVSY